MATLESDQCKYLDRVKRGYACKLRKQEMPIAEVTQKCAVHDLAIICIDAYSSLSRGQASIDEGSTDAFPWLIEASNQFENLQESDNAVVASIKAIDFANKLNLTNKAYTFFCYARTIYEEGLSAGDKTLIGPSIKQKLIIAGQSIIASTRRIKEGSVLTDMQAELKASVLGGISLKKAGKDVSKDLVISHGKALYEKKAKEYREGADNYIESGMIKNAVIFVCMTAISELMLGKPKDGMSYLSNIASNPEYRDEFNSNACFEWTKLVFRGLVSREKTALEEAQTLYLMIPWSFKDDKEFARRAMESVERRISH
ncbi:MAG: hypothetical protein ACTSU3_07310 [Candidatus Thorarchaeota archaeon]